MHSGALTIGDRSPALYTHRLHLPLGRRDPHGRRPRRFRCRVALGRNRAQLSLRPRRAPQAGVAGHHARRARIGTSTDPSRRSESIQASVSRRSTPSVVGYARLGRVDARAGCPAQWRAARLQLCGGLRVSSWRCLNRRQVRLQSGARTSRGALRPHLVVIFLQGAIIMRDARGMCPVPSTAQRRASGFWCRAVEASTAFSPRRPNHPRPLADNVPVHPAFRLNA